MIHRDWLGVSYRAFDTERDRSVTLRLLPRSQGNLLDGQSFLHALRDSLHCSDDPIHANVAAVYDVGEAAIRKSDPQDRTCYVASELIQGERLAAMLTGGAAIDGRRAHVWMTQILLGLGCAHKLGMIHSDLNPSNVVVVAEDDIRLIDVGLYSRELFVGIDESASAGWPIFTSPEQLVGEPASVRSDIRAAGLLFHRMLGGRDPFSGSAASVMQKVLTEELPPLSHFNPELGTRLDGVIARAVARKANERFESAEEFLHALNRAEFQRSAMPRVATAPTTARSTQSVPAEKATSVERATPVERTTPGERATAIEKPTPVERATPDEGATAFEKPTPAESGDSAAQSALTKALADAVGPMASMLVRDAIRQTGSLDRCRVALAAQITDEVARDDFLRATETSVPRVAAAAPLGGVSQPQAQTPVNHADGPLRAEMLIRLKACLAEQIGPMAWLLVDRAAAGAATQGEFVAVLSEMIPSSIPPTLWLQELNS